MYQEILQLHESRGLKKSALVPSLCSLVPAGQREIDSIEMLKKLRMFCYSYASFYYLRWAARGGTYRGLRVQYLYIANKKKFLYSIRFKL